MDIAAAPAPGPAPSAGKDTPPSLAIELELVVVRKPLPKVRSQPSTPSSGEGVELFARERHRDHLRATFSFEHATRDDRTRTRNDWDLQLRGYRAPYTFDVNMTGGDRSGIIDLGPVALDQAYAGSHRITPSADDLVEVVAGHTYLVHTVDSNSDHWACLTVTELTVDGRCRFDWRRLPAPERPGEG